MGEEEKSAETSFVTAESVMKDIVKLTERPVEKEKYIYTQAQIASEIGKNTSSTCVLMKRYDKYLAAYHMRTRTSKSILYSERALEFIRGVLTLRETFRMDHADIMDALDIGDLPDKTEKPWVTLADHLNNHMDEKFDSVDSQLAELLGLFKASLADDSEKERLEKSLKDAEERLAEQESARKEEQSKRESLEREHEDDRQTIEELRTRLAKSELEVEELKKKRGLFGLFRK